MNLEIKKNCINELRKDGEPIIIFKIVREAEAIANACKELGIKVVAFCDFEKRNTLKSFCGFEVIHTPQLAKRYPKARFIISSQYIKESINQLKEMGYNEFFSPLELLENYKVNNFSHQIQNSYMQSQISVFKKSHEAFFNKSKIYMRSVDVMITTKCSMKCESCSNLMQYYSNPQNGDYNKIIDEVKILLNNVDEISEFRVIGGEPMMNKDWAKISNEILNLRKNIKIYIYTNGTIPAKDVDLEMLKNKDVNFVITDYGKLSRNIEKLKSSLAKYEFSYTSTLVENWVDCSTIKQHNRSVQDLNEVYKQCCAKNLYTILNGKLYNCPFIANADNLKAIPNNNYNYIDLLSEKDIRDKINKMINKTKFLPACDFCDGRPYDPTSKIGYDGIGMIEPAKQTEKILDYYQYD